MATEFYGETPTDLSDIPQNAPPPLIEAVIDADEYAHNWLDIQRSLGVLGFCDVTTCILSCRLLDAGIPHRTVKGLVRGDPMAYPDAHVVEPGETITVDRAGDVGGFHWWVEVPGDAVGAPGGETWVVEVCSDVTGKPYIERDVPDYVYVDGWPDVRHEP